MTEDLDRSYGVAEEALKALRALHLAATPRNLELLIFHLGRSNGELSRDLKASIGPDGAMSQEQADRLYEVHILRVDLASEIAEMLQRFETEVGKVAGAVAESGRDSKDHAEALSNLSGALTDKLGTSNADVSRLVDGVLTVVKAVTETNSRLETQLADSSEEITFLKESIAVIQLEAMTDPLTGVKNRKTFDDAIERTVDKSRQDHVPMSLILADVDHFKRFNDRWGHQTGDQVLRLVADMMKANVKGQDVLARYGGEEFAIILPQTTRDNGILLADRIREAVGARALKKRRTNENMGNVTLSMGVATLREDDTVETIIERADRCLYAAKANGRNQVVCDATEPAALSGKASADGAAA
ncbi:MAG: diguanylate cyclase [Alphaproteobacteria bacterium]|nr:diguanylate cyclase [Alphaproteobacteria bacterium]